MDRNLETRISGITQEEAAGFKVPAEFSHTGTDIAQTFVDGNHTGAPKPVANEEVVLFLDEPDSYHLKKYNGFGTQLSGVDRYNGWRTFTRVDSILT